MRQTKVLLIPAALLYGLFIVAGPAGAADSSCKGLKSEACGSNAACSWVKSYKTKKGKDVAGFCRKKPERKAG